MRQFRLKDIRTANGGRWWDRWGSLVLWVFGIVGLLVGALYADLRSDISAIQDDVRRLEGKVNEIHRWTQPPTITDGPQFRDAPIGKPEGDQP